MCKCVTNVIKDSSDPTAIIVLLEASLVVLDLKTDGFPTFRHHHSYLQESAVSVCHYAVDPPRALFNALQHSKEQRQSKQQASSSAASSSSPSSSSTSSFLTNASNTTNTQTPSNQQFISQATISKSFYSSLVTRAFRRHFVVLFCLTHLHFNHRPRTDLSDKRRPAGHQIKQPSLQ